MKAAIYSRVIEEDQKPQVQLFFDALADQGIEPVVVQHFFEQISPSIRFPSNTTTFSSSEDLKGEVEVIISLGGDGTLLDTITLVRDK